MKKTKLIKPTQYISKISIWKYNISFPLLFLLNVVLILLMLALPPSIFVPEVYVKSIQMPNLKIWERYVFFEISTFLISFSVAFIIFLFLNIKKAKKRGLVNLICLFIAFALIEFIYTGFFVSPHKCPESLIQTDYYKCGVGEITFGCYGPSEICIRVLNHIFIPFLFFTFNLWSIPSY